MEGFSKLQVAVLAPLALLVVLEARCVDLSLRSSINIVCCGVVHRCSHTATQHIHVYIIINLSHGTKM